MDEEKGTTDTLYYYYDGSTITIDSVTSEHLCEPVKVYNLEVENMHTYFVGQDGMLVHNVCFTPDQQAVLALASDYHENGGISASEAQILWEFTIGAGFHQCPRYHPPQTDRYLNGAPHIKINNMHILIY